MFNHTVNQAVLLHMQQFLLCDGLSCSARVSFVTKRWHSVPFFIHPIYHRIVFSLYGCMYFTNIYNS